MAILNGLSETFMRKLYYMETAQKSQKTFQIVLFWCCWRFFSLLSTYFDSTIVRFICVIIYFTFFPRQARWILFFCFCFSIFPFVQPKRSFHELGAMNRIKIITKLRQQCVYCVKIIFHLLMAVLTLLFTVYSIYFERQ